MLFHTAIFYLGVGEPLARWLARCLGLTCFFTVTKMDIFIVFSIFRRDINLKVMSKVIFSKYTVADPDLHLIKVGARF